MQDVSKQFSYWIDGDGFFSFLLPHPQDKYKIEILRNGAQTRDEVEYGIRSDVLQQRRVTRATSALLQKCLIQILVLN